MAEKQITSKCLSPTVCPSLSSTYTLTHTGMAVMQLSSTSTITMRSRPIGSHARPGGTPSLTCGPPQPPTGSIASRLGGPLMATPSLAPTRPTESCPPTKGLHLLTPTPAMGTHTHPLGESEHGNDGPRTSAYHVMPMWVKQFRFLLPMAPRLLHFLCVGTITTPAMSTMERPWHSLLVTLGRGLYRHLTLRGHLKAIQLAAVPAQALEAACRAVASEAQSRAAATLMAPTTGAAVTLSATPPLIPPPTALQTASDPLRPLQPHPLR